MFGSSSPKVSGPRWSHQWCNVLGELQSFAAKTHRVLTRGTRLSGSSSPRWRMNECQSQFIWTLLTNHSVATIIRSILAGGCWVTGPGHSAIWENRSEKRWPEYCENRWRIMRMFRWYAMLATVYRVLYKCVSHYRVTSVKSLLGKFLISGFHFCTERLTTNSVDR